MDEQDAPSDSPQKLGVRASTAMTSSREGLTASSRPAGVKSSAPRWGSAIVNLSRGVINNPARPTMKNAMRQLIRLVMYPASTMPAALPMGMPKEYTLNARARSLGGK